MNLIIIIIILKKFSDYEIVRVLGSGAFARALLVANKKTKQLFTCKQIKTVDEDTSSEIDLVRKKKI